MQSLVQILVVVAAVVAHTYGLRCWTCYNAIGSEDCMRNGELRTCDDNERMCFSSLRNVDGRWEITKRCKQPKACENNHIQNPRHAWIKSQCQPKKQGSVCRCCCGTDACNADGFRCLKRPECPAARDLLNGRVDCDYSELETEIGSVCHFECNDGYQLVGNLTSTCRYKPHGRSRFDRPWPVCQPTMTECELQTGILNGQISCNLNGTEVGTTCGFTCDPGYFLVGSETNICVDTGNGIKWSLPKPHCDPIICVPDQVAPVHGSVDCTSNVLGTVCNFYCDDGATMMGSNQTECIEDFGPFGKWSEPAPICMADFSDAAVIDCKDVDPPVNGEVFCDEDNTECIFMCNDGFGMHGRESISCLPDGNWSDLAPTCVPTNCGAQTPIAHGQMQCTKGTNVTSQCSFSCAGTTGRELYPEDVSINECVITPEGKAAWMPPPPCCGHPCPPFVLMDLVVVLDSSSSVGNENWVKQVKFTKMVIKQFKLGADGSRMSIFRYNSEIDEETEIKLSDTIGLDMTDVLNLFDKIPYNGSGTQTGQALQHVQAKSLSAAYGNRPDIQDVILVITDGKASDAKLVKSVAQELRADGALIFAVGIGLDPIVYGKLVKMTGSESRTINVQNFNNLLEGGFVEKLGKRLCHDPCA